MPTETFAFSVAFVALLGAPVLSPAIAWYLPRAPLKIQRVAFALMSAVVACVAVALPADLSTPSYEANAIVMAASLVCAGVLGLSAFRLKRRPWNRILGGLACALLALVLFVGTAGALMVLFIIGDTVPVHVAALPDHRTCYVHTYGNAFTSPHGYDVAVRRRFALLPFLELPAVHHRIDSPQPVDPAQFCSASAWPKVDGR